MRVREYGSEEFVNILYQMNSFLIYIPDFMTLLPFKQKKQPLGQDRLFNFIRIGESYSAGFSVLGSVFFTAVSAEAASVFFLPPARRVLFDASFTSPLPLP